MRIGAAGYPVPRDVPREHAVAWTIEAAARLGLQIVGGSFLPLTDPDNYRYDDEELSQLRDLADAKGIEIEPYIRGPFDLIGPAGIEEARLVRTSMRAARILGGPYVRTGYGRLKIESSRFNRAIRLEDHLAKLVANLRQAATIAADEGVVIALENHCDFTGREIARVIQEVDSPAVRAALDTGNSVIVFCDPADDLAALAPLSVTTHLKDMAIVQHDTPGRIPFLPVGCALGEGIVDIPATVRTLFEQAPRGRETPLIVETGWIPVEPDQERGEVIRRAFARSIDYLRGLAA